MVIDAPCLDISITTHIPQGWGLLSGFLATCTGLGPSFYCLSKKKYQAHPKTYWIFKHTLKYIPILYIDLKKTLKRHLTTYITPKYSLVY